MNRKERIQKEMDERKRLNLVSPLERHVIWWLNECRIYEFQREYQIGPYLADLFFEQLNLVIELDGMTFHANRKEEDAKKDEYLIKNGYRVWRWPSENCWNPTFLGTHIAKLVDELTPNKHYPPALMELGYRKSFKKKASYDALSGGWVDEWGCMLSEDDLCNYEIQ